jgi:hypothetical protein
LNAALWFTDRSSGKSTGETVMAMLRSRGSM